MPVNVSLIWSLMLFCCCVDLTYVINLRLFEYAGSDCWGIFNVYLCSYNFYLQKYNKWLRTTRISAE